MALSFEEWKKKSGNEQQDSVRRNDASAQKNMITQNAAQQRIDGGNRLTFEGFMRQQEERKVLEEQRRVEQQRKSSEQLRKVMAQQEAIYETGDNAAENLARQMAAAGFYGMKAGESMDAYGSESAERENYIASLDTKTALAELEKLNKELESERQRYNRTKIQYASYGNNTNSAGARAAKRYIDDYDAKQARAATLKKDIEEASALQGAVESVQRQAEYSERHPNTYIPASLAQNAIHRSGTGDDFTAYSDRALRSEYLRNVDTDSLQAELDMLNKALESNEKQYNRTKAQYASYGNNTSDNGARAAKRYIDDYEARQKRAAELRQDISEAESIKRYEKYETLSQREDFAEKSAAAGSKRIEFSVFDPSTWRTGDDRYDFINDIDGYRNNHFAGLETDKAKVMGVERDLSEYGALSHMTQDEIATYNYLYATEGKEAADEYIAFIQDALNYRVGMKDAENVGDNALKAMSYGFQTGIEQFGTGIADAFSAGERPATASEYGAQAVRENLSDAGFKLPESMGGASIGQVAFDFAHTTGNMAPSILLSTLTAGMGASAALAQGVGSASMGLSAGGAAKMQALREGYTNEQATSYGMLVGASEGALQYLLGGVSKLGGKLTNHGIQTAVQNIDNALLRVAASGAIKMAGEGTEEYLQEIIEPIYRNLIFNENNQVDLTDPNAVYSFMLGALTSGVLEGRENISEAFNAVKAQRNQGEGSAAADMAPDVSQNVEQAQNAQPIQAETQTAPKTEQYVYTDEATGLPMVGERTVRRMNAAADEISTTLDGATKHGYAVQEGKNGGADLSARGKTIHLDAVEATAIAEAYEGGMDAVEYTMAFHAIYEQAKQGKELGQIRKTGVGRSFAKPDIKAAYSAGRLANQRAAVLDPNSEFRSGVTVLPEVKLSRDQETQLNVLDALCRKYGITAIADDALYMGETGNARSDVNAAYNGNTNRIHINLNAIGDAYLAVGVHELTHYVRANNEAGYSTLENFVLDALRGEGEDVNALVRYQMDQFGYSEEIAREEVVANTIPAILNDESYVKRLIETDRTLAERIRDFLREFVDTIKETLSTLEGEASWRQMQSVRQDTELLSTIADMFDAALGDTQAKHSKSDSGKKYSPVDKYFARQIDQWDGKDHGGSFRVGSVSDALLAVGIPDVDIWFDQSKAAKQLNEKEEITKDVLKAIPELLEHPIAISESYDNTVIVFGHLYDAKRNPIVVAVRINATNRRNKISLVNKVRSVGTRTHNLDKLLSENEILYLGKNKKETVNWFNALGRSTPFGGTKFGLIRSIRDSGENSNLRFSAQKKNLSATSDANAHDITPEVTDGFGSANSIRNSSEKTNLSAQDAETNAVAEQEKTRATELTGKRKAYKRRHERAFIENVAKALGIPGTAKGELRKMISELGDRVIATGQLSEADAKAMFEKCYEAAREYDNGMVEQYGTLKEYLRNKAIRSTDLTSEQRNEARGKLRVNGNGAPLANVYDDLLAEFPGVFDDSLTSPEDQLAEILKQYDSIKTREYTLDEFYGENAAAAKMEARANFEEELFQLRRKLNLAERSETVEHAKRQERLRTAAEAENIQTVEKALSEIKEKQKAFDRVQSKLALTDGDRALIDAVFKGGITLGELQNRSNFDELKTYYDARSEVESRKKIVEEYNKKRRERLRNDAMNAIENSDRWKDKRIGGLYERETQERNIRDITGNEQDAERIIAGYIQPVHENEAKRTRYINDMNKRMLALELNKWESKATQLIGEAADYKERLAEIEKRGMDRGKEAKLIQKGLDLVGTEYAKLVEKHGDKIDRAKCEAALPTVRGIYDQVFQDMNDALVRNGYPKVEYRKNYFPHFIGREYDSEGQKVAKAFGFNLTNMELPTDIAGLTSAFRPGKTWFANALERMGVKTEFDLYGGFDGYIRGATDIIFHTDDIQQLRALDNAIRYKYSDDGRKARMQELMENEDITPEERAEQINALYTDEKGNSMKTHLSGYVSNLTEYTNLLANKKSLQDRAAEKRWGRTIYSLANWFQNRYSANAIAGNIGVALSNFIPITQATSEVGSVTLLNAMRDTVKAFARDDGFYEQSAFLTNRRGADTLSKDWIAKASDTLSIPFEGVDRFASETLVRAKFAQNMKAGMSYEAAMENADAWAAGLMADRSKGALPTIFGSKSPLAKAFTMFQVEGNNQLSYMFKDVPRDMKKKGITAIVGALLKMFLAAWMYNELDEQITGRRRALDPIHMIAEAVGVDWKTENVIPRIAGTKTADDAPLITYDPQTWVSAAEDTYKNIVDQTPFFGSLLGGDGGRSPAAAAMPDLWRIAKTLGDEKTDGAYKGQVAWDELKKPLFYILPPFAGGQVKKTIEGIQTVQEGGSYKKDKGGNDLLRFRTDQTGLDYAQAALFGSWALPEGRENIAQGFPVLTAQHTAAYKNAVENGVDGAHFLVLLNEYKQLEPIKDEEGNTVKNTSEQFREILFRDSTLTQEQKQAIDRDVLNLKSGPADYSSSTMFELWNTSAAGYANVKTYVQNGIAEDVALKVEKYRQARLMEGSVKKDDYVKYMKSVGMSTEQINIVLAEANKNWKPIE